jgi:hypothetical protein
MTDYVCETCEFTITQPEGLPKLLLECVLESDFVKGRCKTCSSPLKIIQEKDVEEYLRKYKEDHGYTTYDSWKNHAPPEHRTRMFEVKK